MLKTGTSKWAGKRAGPKVGRSIYRAGPGRVDIEMTWAGPGRADFELKWAGSGRAESKIFHAPGRADFKMVHGSQL